MVDPSRFPIAVLPLPLREYVEQHARAMGAPVDLIAVPLLAALSVAIGASRRIGVKRGWVEPAVIWTAIAAEPGSGKSPALRCAMRGVEKHQEQLAARFREETVRWRKEQRDSDGQDVGQKPTLPQVVVTDSTTEALADVLCKNPRGVICQQDELAALAGSFNQYKAGRGRDRQTWSSFWNCSPVAINRRNRDEPLHLAAPFVAVTGAIPPDLLGELLDERGREDGFLARFLMAWPDSERRGWTDYEPEQSVTEPFDELFSNLFSLHDANPLVLERPPRLPFTTDARKLFAEYYDELVAAGNEAPPFLRPALAKYSGYSARLALVLQLACWASEEADGGQVEERAMDGAVLLIEYFRSHLRRVHEHVRGSAEQRQRRRIVDKVRELGGSASVRDLVTAKLAADAHEARRLLRGLESDGQGAITTKRPKGGGRQGEVFRLKAAGASD